MKKACVAVWVIGLLGGVSVQSVAYAQSVPSQNNPTFVVTAPIVDLIDKNNVSILSGKVNIDLPLIDMGDVKYTEQHVSAIATGFFNDANLGHVVACMPVNANIGYGGSSECAGNMEIQAVYGTERSTFYYSNGQYKSVQASGETFVDNQNGSCTWTQKDGTQILYFGYHASNNPLCQSQNISKVIKPDGSVSDYFYYGAISNTAPNALLSIASSRGFLLKYIYPGTPAAGGQASVVAVNRAFQACDPSAISCTLSGSWPVATFVSQPKTVSVSDGFPPAAGHSGTVHHIVTLTDAQQNKHIFETDSIDRVISYQPPGAETPVVQYVLCSLLADPVLGDVSWPIAHCFGQTNWRLDSSSDQAPALFNMVESATRNGQTWNYSVFPTGPDGDYPPFSRWTHSVADPLGLVLYATGNATPGAEGRAGPIEKVINRDGSQYLYEASVRNPVTRYVRADGAITTYGYDARTNLSSISEAPASGSANPHVRTASFPTSCATLLSCNKPDYVIDANSNRTDYTYDSQHGGVLTETGPAVNGIRPQKRYAYTQRYAWYLNGSGTMVKETRPIWVLASESHCRTGAASGNGCAIANDEVVTTYDYGPDAGPNNLLLRGVTVSAEGRTLRSCYGHDHYGNKIWERSPNAGMTSCPDY